MNSPRLLPGYRLLAALLFVSSLGRPALGASDTLAEVLFLEGRQALEAEDFAEACAKFRESQRLDPAPGTLMNLATCLERLGRLASAWQSWQEALRLLPAGDDREPFARKRVRELETKLPYLTIRLAPNAPVDTSFFSNGVRLERAALDIPLPVDPGEQVIVVRAPGHADKKFRVRVSEGERRELVVSAGALLPEPAADAAVKQAPERDRIWAYVAGGVGLAGIGTGVATGLMLPSRREAVQSNCEDYSCNDAGWRAVREGRILLLANTAAWLAGAAGLGVGTYLWITSKASPQPAVAADISADGATVTYSGRF